MKKIVMSLLALALVARLAIPCAAEETNAATAAKPVAVLSLAGYDRIMADLDFIGNLAGNPDLAKSIEGGIQLFTQGQGLAGIDKKRPWGITLTTDGTQFQPLIFLPVEKNGLKQLLDAVAGLLGEAQEAGDGAYELSIFNQKIFAKEQDAWAYFSMSPEIFAALPADPTKLLGGMEKTYDVGLRLHVQNVPDQYRSLILDQLRLGVDVGMAKLPDESDEAFTARRKVVETQMETLAKAINDLEQLTIGWSLDSKAGTSFVDLNISAVAGSDTGKQMSQLKSGKSDFSGFLLPDASASLNVTAMMGTDNATQILSALQSLRSQLMQRIDTEGRLPDDTTKKLVKEMVDEVFKAVTDTLASGKIDLGAAAKLGEKTMAIVVGAHVADPKGLEDALRRLAQLTEKEPNFPAIKFDASQHAGIRFHTAVVPVPGDAKIAKVVGDHLDVAVGIGEQSVYLAVGTDSMNLLKKLIDQSKADASKLVPPMQLNVALAPIFQFAAAIEDNPETKDRAESLAKSQGKDLVHLVLMPQSNALTIRVEVQEAVIELVARAIASIGLPGLGQ